MSEDIAVDLNALAREQDKPELRFQWSPQIDKLAGALAKAQGAMTNASKDSANPYFKSKYADLAAVVDVIRKPLADNELAYVQPFTTGARQVTVSTVIMHSSGQWMSTEATFPVLPMPRKKDEGQPYTPPSPNEPVTPQAFGSAETYLRRYALQSMLGLAAEDDDANSSSGHAFQPKQSASDVVRGAVARPNTASARKSDTKEAPTASQSDDLMRRVLSFSDKATKAGMKTPEIREYAAKVLGHKHPSVEFTSEDMDLLEAAWAKRDK